MDVAGNAITYLSEIQPVDFEQPRALWEKVFDDAAKERFVSNVSGHMSNCRSKDIIARQLAIFHEASPELASRISKATGVSNYNKGIAGMSKFLQANTHTRLRLKPLEQTLTASATV